MSIILEPFRRVADVCHTFPFDRKLKEIRQEGIVCPDRRRFPINLNINPQNDMELFYYRMLRRVYRNTKSKDSNYAPIIYLVIIYCRRILKQRTVVNINNWRTVIQTDDYPPWYLSRR